MPEEDQRRQYIVEIFLTDRVLVIATDNVEFTRTMQDESSFTPDPDA